MTPTLPADGRRIAFVGKGGSGKSTAAAHVLAHWADKGVPAVGIDTDKPGDDEAGSLYAWADLVDLGAPVYPAPSTSRLAAETRRLTPARGVALLDTGAWLRTVGGPHMTTLASVDLAVLTLPPTDIELDRAGSVFTAIEHLEAIGAAAPRLVVLLTLVNRSAASGDETRTALTDAGYRVLRTTIPRSDARDGYAQSFGKPPRVSHSSPMGLLAAELLTEVAE